MKLLWVVNQAVVSLRGMGVIRICTTYVYTGLWERRNKRLTTYKEVVEVALFYMPNSNRFNILSISIFSEISLSISIFSKISLSISISIFSRTALAISIFSRIALSISIFLEWPYRFRYRYQYFPNLPIYRLSI